MEVFETFWSEKFWLPGNLTWKSIEPGTRDGIQFRNYYDLWYSIPLAVAITIVKSIMIREIFMPLGKYLQIKSTKFKPLRENVILERFYQKFHKELSLTAMQIANLRKQTDLTEREIQRWLRKRKAQNKSTTLEKFCENCWRCSFYSFNFLFGLYVMWNREWLWNLNVISNYPYHSIDNGILCYYNITAAFYISSSFTHFFETRRKDFWQMFIHHIITLALISISWICNGIRGGALIVFVHDIADILLESSKAAKYANAENLCNVIFVLFTIVWILTRLLIYGRIVFIGHFEFPKMYPIYPLYYVFSALTIGLFLLHLLWTYMIFQVANRLILTKKFDDVRSSTEDTESELGSDINEQTDINKNKVIRKKNGTNGRKQW
ncbi:hypothetical protein PVAND_011919 [Polypedilum vanderplanki]|uniref:TLC domain-containing protein n=1 Tax=Polypedilum vanderplanki TaxID=319348 RepID=A0A9J6CLU3_POLVA|nr:hypothetical protein PVAND_011919 [Polypedilum vanderplanki]